MAAESEVQSEIEVLQSIYLEELQVDRREDGGWEVSLVLYPSTAEDSVSQFVRLTLTLSLDWQYPSSSPVISIHNPRGLSDDKLSSVQKCLQAEAQSWLGSPVLYQLIEKAKEILTESNIPHGNCVICLYGFKEGETFTKTSCYHYFHSHCLGRYVSHSERELQQRERELQEDKTRDGGGCQELTVVCPVCREPLTYDIDQLLTSPAPELPELDQEAIGSDFQRKWGELRRLREKQRCNGGIINPEEESNRFLIHIQEAPPVAENGNPEVDASLGPPVSSSNEAGVRAEHFVPGPSQIRGFQVQRRQNQARGPRRGGRPRPHSGQGAPISEQLEQLSLSSDCTDQSNAIKVLGDGGRQLQRDLLSCWTRTEEEPPNHHHHLSAPETEGPKVGAGGRGHRGRRRGPYRPAGAPGPPQQHQDGRARSRGGANHPCSRGGGPRRGHYGGGLREKVVERGREEVV